MTYNFDTPIERRGSDSYKWTDYGDEVLPLWVADMDFISPPAVLEALHHRIDHGVFGYGRPSPHLPQTICERMQRLYGWTVTPEQIVFLPGLVSGLNAVCRAVNEPGAGVLVQTPVYPPFLTAPANQGLILQTAQLALTAQERLLRYDIDYEVFESAITAETRLFILCNPHNPVGRCFTREELARLADICLRHNIIICSDEIHCDLLLDGAEHLPIAALSSEVAQQTITLMAPSKTFNIAGLECGFAIIQNSDLMKQFTTLSRGIVPGVNVLGATAALAAYQNGGEWLTQLLAYLTANRDFLVEYVLENLPSLRTTIPEGTYLAWLDCRDSGIPGNPYHFFLKEARAALGEGSMFGPGGDGFVRLNFGCTRATLHEALERMRVALKTV
ncbi:MAG: PatB family C-S lyase [Anaerolineae bacterium]